MSGRERELYRALRAGGGEGPATGQLFTESLIMGLAGRCPGVLLHPQSLKLLVDFTRRLTPRARENHVDLWMLLFRAGGGISNKHCLRLRIGALFPRRSLGGLKDGAMHATTGAGGAPAATVLGCLPGAFSFLLLDWRGSDAAQFQQASNVDPGLCRSECGNVRRFTGRKYSEQAEQKGQVSESVLHKIQRSRVCFMPQYHPGIPWMPTMGGMDQQIDYSKPHSTGRRASAGGWAIRIASSRSGTFKAWILPLVTGGTVFRNRLINDERRPDE